MNPERWAEIASSFDFNQSETLVRVSTSSEEVISAEKASGVLHTNFNEPKKSEGWNMQLETPLQTSFSQENLTVQSGFNTDDQGKVIENLCKIVKEKAEKIKIQEKLIDLLNSRVQRESSYKDSCMQTDVEEKNASDTYEATSMKKIACLIETLERRLNLVINFIQRKFPKDVLIAPESDAEKKERIESVLRRTWDKPSVHPHPRPTYGSLMREIHSRNRIDKERPNLSDNAVSHTYRHATRIPRSREDDLERRIEVLESLVVLLKGKIMKRINSRRK